MCEQSHPQREVVGHSAGPFLCGPGYIPAPLWATEKRGWHHCQVPSHSPTLMLRAGYLSEYPFLEWASRGLGLEPLLCWHRGLSPPARIVRAGVLEGELG